jgi:hypothetical protein
MNTSPDHPDFTALALGEHIHGTPAQAVIEALRTSVAARSEAEQIQTTARHLSFALKGQPPLRLDAERRNAILNADLDAVRTRFEEEERTALEFEPVRAAARRGRTWVYPTLAAAAVAAAAFFVLRLLPGYTPPSQRPQGSVAEVEPGTGIINVTPPSRITPAKRVTDPVQAPAAVAVTPDPVQQPLPQGRDLPGPVDTDSVKEPRPDLPVLPAPQIQPAPAYASPRQMESSSSSSEDQSGKRESSRYKRKN